mmetsp:Transcript_45034/g.114183  ORF Transcript_45034/g.114183 Transcript_45034/m.114183 type:complete len:233 (-) Transcript_45034:4-702(-)
MLHEERHIQRVALWNLQDERALRNDDRLLVVEHAEVHGTDRGDLCRVEACMAGVRHVRDDFEQAVGVLLDDSACEPLVVREVIKVDLEIVRHVDAAEEAAEGPAPDEILIEFRLGLVRGNVRVNLQAVGLHVDLCRCYNTLFDGNADVHQLRTVSHLDQPLHLFAMLPEVRQEAIIMASELEHFKVDLCVLNVRGLLLLDPRVIRQQSRGNSTGSHRDAHEDEADSKIIADS